MAPGQEANFANYGKSIDLLHNNCLLSVLVRIASKSTHNIRGMFEMNCLLSSSSISTWGTIKTNTYLYRVIQYLHNGV